MTRATTKAIASREYFNTREAADRMRVSIDVIRAAIATGALRAKNTSGTTGGKTLVSSSALDAWFNALPEPGENEEETA